MSNLTNFEEIFRAPGSEGAKGLNTGEIGQARNMRLPAGWRPGERHDGRIFSQAFHLESNAGVTLVFRYRGYRVSKEAASEFVRILAQKPGHASLPDSGSLREIIGILAHTDVFAIETARVESINGRHVLSTQGRYHKDRCHELTIYVDADRSEPGTVVQEIHYLAPSAVFDQYLEHIRDAFRTIVWK